MLHRLLARSSRISAAVALAAVVLAAPAARADDLPYLRQEMAEAAKQIKKRLDDRGDKAVVMDKFRGPKTNKNATGGPVIERLLSEELTKAGVEVKNQAPVAVAGKFRDVTDKESKQLAAQIEIQLQDKDEEPIGDPIIRGVFGATVLQALFGPTGDIPPKSSDAQRAAVIAQQIDNPTVFIKDGRVSASQDGKFAIEVLVGDEARPAKDQDGVAFVDVKRDESYGVRITNDNDFEIAVALRIDGLSMFEFMDDREATTGGPTLDSILVAPHSNAVVRGWYVTDKQSDKFTVTEYSKSAAASKSISPGSSDVGTITASYRASWEKGAAPPADEKGADYSSSKDGDATGRGERFDANFTVVERNFGANRGSVSVRYTRPVN